ncbi:unnamed protein product, partial [marine sediment metagenome]
MREENNSKISMYKSIELKKVIKNTYYLIRNEWLSRIGKESEAKFEAIQYFKLCIAHFSTCRWISHPSSPHVTFQEMISSLYWLQTEIKTTSYLLDRRQISDTFKTI